MSDQKTDIAAPIFKVASAWALIGVTSWAEFASFLAACYTMMLIAEWTWKKICRPLLVRYGFLPALRRSTDASSDDAEATD